MRTTRLKSFFTLTLILTSCAIKERQEIKTTAVREESWGGILYQPTTLTKSAALIIASADGQQHERWSPFCQKIAARGYSVMIVKAGELEPAAIELPSAAARIRAATDYVLRLPEIKSPVVVMGENQSGIAAVMAAAEDSVIAGVITFDTFFNGHSTDILQALEQNIKTPLLIISASDDPLVPQVSIKMFYEKLKNPKKLVWLATKEHGADALRTDMEPIVRRVTLMFLDKVFKK